MDNFTQIKKVCVRNGMLLPGIGTNRDNVEVWAVLYFIGLLWHFLGVAIIADIFMCSIQQITSQTHIVTVPNPNAPGCTKQMEVKSWNETVANLSLLALGSSAPDIFLSVIEVIGSNFKAGELGPGTLVGSAAYNLLVICAICIVVIPRGEVRRIKKFKVFVVTACSCVLAYIWLAFVLLVITPGIVELWEATLTILMFPLLILAAYLADLDFGLKQEEGQPGFMGIALGAPLKVNYKIMEDEEGKQIEKRLRESEVVRRARELSNLRSVNEEVAAKMAAKKLIEEESHNQGWYRIHAIRCMTGSKRLIPQVTASLQALFDRMEMDVEERVDPSSESDPKPIVEFTATDLAVFETEGKIRIGIRRYGRLSVPATVRVETVNGSAFAGKNYNTFDEIIEFKKDEILHEIYVNVIHSLEWKPDEFFYVKLSVESGSNVSLGNVAVCQITIINVNKPGILVFANPSIVVKESSMVVRIPVERLEGADGIVSVFWETKDLSAKNGIDYDGGHGELNFDSQEINRTINISLIQYEKPDRHDSFQISLLKPSGGAVIGEVKKAIITIVNDNEYNELVIRILDLTRENTDALKLEKSTFRSQFCNAMKVNGGDLESATFLSYVLHFITVFWKVLFACVPPPHYLRGWPTFFASLVFIGLLTASIADLAGGFGCLVGLEDSITAITLVALGTSMPDTLASKTAAIMEKYADNSIINITGSSCINAFLGLGVSWLIASFYWNVVKGKDFVVEPGTLGFSVSLYTVFATIALSILVLRRKLAFFGKGELGGAVIPKYLCCALFIFLWAMYILLSVLQVKKIIVVNM